MNRISDMPCGIRTRRSQYGRALQLGFTLSELLVVLAIVAIVVAYMAPMFSRTLSDNRLSAVQNSMNSTLSEARSLALSLPIAWYVSVVPGAGSAVTVASTSNNNWSNGWRIITVPYVGTAGAGALATSGLSWVGATATQVASQVAESAPDDQVYLGYVPTTTSGISVQVYSNSLMSTTAPNTTLTSINFDNNGNVVDNNGNILTSHVVIVQACDIGLSGTTSPVPGLGLTLVNARGSLIPVSVAGPLPAYVGACP